MSTHKKDTMWVTATQILVVTTGLGRAAIIAALLSKEQVAIIFWIAATSRTLAMVAALGTPQAIVAASKKQGNNSVLRFGSVAATGSIFVAGLWWITGGFTPAKFSTYVFVVGLWLIVRVFTDFSEATMRSQKDFKKAMLVSVSTRSIILSIGVLAVYAGFNFHLMLVLATLAELAVVIAIASKVRLPAQLPVSKKAFKSISFLPLSATASILPAGGVWIAAGSVPIDLLAEYALAVQVSALLVFPLLVTTKVLGPKIASSTYLHSLSSIVKIHTRASTALVLLGFVVLLFSKPLFDWALPDYESLWMLSIILACGQVVSNIVGPCGVVLANKGHVLSVSTASLVATFFFIAGGWVAASIWGVVGLAVAAMIATGLLNLFLLYRCTSLFGFNPSIKGTSEYKFEKKLVLTAEKELTNSNNLN